MKDTGTNLLLTIDSQTLEVPESRIQDANSCVDIHYRLRDADLISSQQRTVVQAMIDGQPPWSEAQLSASGRGDMINVNYQEGAAQVEQASLSYVELIQGVENLVDIQTEYGFDDREKQKYSKILSEEFTRMLRAEPAFAYNFQLLVKYFIAQGVSVAYFEDEFDWRWRPSYLEEFKIPRETKASESEIEVCTSYRYYQAQELYKYIRNESAATEMGWDVEATKAAISRAQSNRQIPYRNPEWWENQLKNNDIWAGITTASQIPVIHVWAKEFDGSVSHYLVEDGTPDNKFLYKRRSKFKNMNQAFTFFTYGIGNNGYYHSIRGLGYKIFPMVQESNFIRSCMAQTTLLTMVPMIQPANEDALIESQLIYNGALTVLRPGNTLIPLQMPNYSTSAMPVLGDLARLIQGTTGSYNTQAIVSDGTEKTKFQYRAELTDKAKMNVAAIQLFYEPWTRLLRETVRRVKRKTYQANEPGGVEVFDFIKRCMERGVPKLAIEGIDVGKVKAVKAVGAGSEAAKLLAFDRLLELASGMDEVGKRNLLRDIAGSTVGYETVDRFFPDIQGDRSTDDAAIAQLENGNLMNGQVIQVLPHQNHLTHARIHLPLLEEQVATMREQPATLVNGVEGLVNLLEHATVHVDYLSQNPMYQDEAGQMRKILSDANEIVHNGMRAIEKIQRDQMKQMAEGQESAQPQQNDVDSNYKLEARLREHQAKLQMMAEGAQLKANITLAQAQQKMAIRDAEQAQKLRNQGIIR